MTNFNKLNILLNSTRYIVSKDSSTQTIYVCFCDHANHPALIADTFFTDTPHWIGGRDTPSRVAESQKRSELFGFSVSIFIKLSDKTFFQCFPI